MPFDDSFTYAAITLPSVSPTLKHKNENGIHKSPKNLPAAGRLTLSGFFIERISEVRPGKTQRVKKNTKKTDTASFHM